MDLERLWTIQKTLTAMHDRLHDQLSQSETDSVQALSSYDNHPADLGTDTFERELDVGLTVGIQRRLDGVSRAMQKIRENTYGTCDRCGETIDPTRLSVRPESLYCLPCQEIVDAPYIPPPSEAEVVPMPFGHIERGDVEPDGEDIWQSVAQWGNSDTPQDTPPAIDYQETYVDFPEPVGYVEEIESIVDADGEVLFDALREKERRRGLGIDKESEEYPL